MPTYHATIGLRNSRTDTLAFKNESVTATACINRPLFLALRAVFFDRLNRNCNYKNHIKRRAIAFSLRNPNASQQSYIDAYKLLRDINAIKVKFKLELYETNNANTPGRSANDHTRTVKTSTPAINV